MKKYVNPEIKVPKSRFGLAFAGLALGGVALYGVHKFLRAKSMKAVVQSENSPQTIPPAKTYEPKVSMKTFLA